MNGKVYLKGVPYFSDSQVVELTQAEYDALGDSKNSDGILYCIKDGGLNVNNRFSPVIYSTIEREIGVWTDNKPLYQRTIHISALPSTPFVETSYSHNIQNIDTICDYFGVARWTDGGVAPLTRIYIPAGAPTTTDKYMWRKDCSWQFQCNKTNIIIATGSDRSAINADVTVRYTKTTDTAGSGTWGTDGMPMHHYDNVERIIGTWTSGETLYEKTVTIPYSNASRKTNFVVFSIRTGDFPNPMYGIKEISGYVSSSSTGCIPIGGRNYRSENNAIVDNKFVECLVYYNDVILYDSQGLADLDNVVAPSQLTATVKYTKNT